MESLIQEKLGKKTPACNQLSCYWNRGAETNMSTHTCMTNIMGYYVKLNPRASSPFRVASEASGIIFCVPLAHDLSQYLENEWVLLSFFGLSQSLSHSQTGRSR